MFFSKKEYPESVTHDAVIAFLKSEKAIRNWDEGMSVIEGYMSKYLKHEREYKDGVLTYRYKFNDLVQYLKKSTGLPKKKIRKELNRLAFSQ